MRWMNSMGMGLRSLFAKRRVERELDEELAGFLEAAAADKQRGGMSAEQARRAAMAEMGSRNAVKHQVWSSRWESGVEGLLQDLRIGLRALAKSPGFTAVALLSLALGIGANTAIFTLLNAILLRPLPVPHPEQLYLFGKGQWVGSMDGKGLRAADAVVQRRGLTGQHPDGEPHLAGRRGNVAHSCRPSIGDLL
jgi:hypothetical protein